MRLKLNYLIIPIFTIAVAWLGSWLTQGGMDWYKTLIKPALNPPNWSFGVAWTTIYILTTLSALIVWNVSKQKKALFIFIILFFVLNAILNVLWSYIFFNQHLLFLATIEAGILALTVLVLVIAIWPVSRLASLLLLPYLGWVSFATYLAYQIWTINT